MTTACIFSSARTCLKMIFVFSALIATPLANATSKQEQPLDNIVAIVNENVITQSEFNQSLQVAKNQLAAENMTPPPENELKKQVLQQLINQKLELEIAEQNGIQINDNDLNKIIARIAQENGISVEEFYTKIQQGGLSPAAYRRQIRQTLTQQKLQQQEVASRITVSSSEITTFLKTHHSQSIGEKEYHIQDILVAIPESPTAQQLEIAKKSAEAIASKLHHGTPLAELSSTENATLQDNDLNWRKINEVPTAFTHAVVKMTLNQFSNPIQTANGFHIIHLIGVRELPGVSKQPQRQEVAQQLFQHKFEEALQNWLAKIRGQAFIVIHDQSLT